MKNIQTYIDNTLLKSDATPEMIEKLCKESIEYGFASVCVNPGYVPLAAIACRQKISEKYLESILSVLSKAGMLDALRGKGGGYRLAKAPEDYSVYEILCLTEGTLAPVTCLEDGRGCENAASCRTYPLWQGLDETVRNYLSDFTLVDVLHMKK